MKDEKKSQGLSRRGFLKGAGVTTAGATLLLDAQEAEAATPRAGDAT